MHAEIIVSADPLAIDEGLRRRVDSVLLLERSGLFTGLAVVILDREALTFEQILCLQPAGAEMVGHDPPVDRGALFALSRYTLFTPFGLSLLSLLTASIPPRGRSCQPPPLRHGQSTTTQH